MWRDQESNRGPQRPKAITLPLCHHHHCHFFRTWNRGHPEFFFLQHRPPDTFRFSVFFRLIRGWMKNKLLESTFAAENRFYWNSTIRPKNTPGTIFAQFCHCHATTGGLLYQNGKVMNRWAVVVPYRSARSSLDGQVLGLIISTSKPFHQSQPF